MPQAQLSEVHVWGRRLESVVVLGGAVGAQFSQPQVKHAQQTAQINR
jgi:uncharacterized membrane protein YsdA (DUF1294 family)